jgi:hypothetical protein
LFFDIILHLNKNKCYERLAGFGKNEKEGGERMKAAAESGSGGKLVRSFSSTSDPPRGGGSRAEGSWKR